MRDARARRRSPTRAGSPSPARSPTARARPGPAINVYMFTSARADHRPSGAGRRPPRPTPTPTVGGAGHHRRGCTTSVAATSRPGQTHELPGSGAAGDDLASPASRASTGSGCTCSAATRAAATRSRTAEPAVHAAGRRPGPRPARHRPGRPDARAGAARRRRVGCSDARRWNAAFVPEGRLGRLLDLGDGRRRSRSPGWSTPRCSTPSGSLAHGNPPIALATRRRQPGPPPASPSAEPEPVRIRTAERQSGRRPARPARRRPAADAAGAAAAAAGSRSSGHRRRPARARRCRTATWTSPRRSADRALIYRRAAGLSAATLPARRLRRSGGRRRPAGTCRRRRCAALSRATPVLLGDGTPGPTPAARSREPRRPGAAWCRTDRRPLRRARARRRRYDALALRQRIAGRGRAARALADRRSRWSSPAAVLGTRQRLAASGFFAGLDLPWLQLVDLPSVAAAGRPGPQAATAAGLPERGRGRPSSPAPTCPPPPGSWSRPVGVRCSGC